MPVWLPSLRMACVRVAESRSQATWLTTLAESATGRRCISCCSRQGTRALACWRFRPFRKTLLRGWRTSGEGARWAACGRGAGGQALLTAAQQSRVQRAVLFLFLQRLLTRHGAWRAVQYQSWRVRFLGGGGVDSLAAAADALAGQFEGFQAALRGGAAAAGQVSASCRALEAGEAGACWARRCCPWLRSAWAAASAFLRAAAGRRG